MPEIGEIRQGYEIGKKSSGKYIWHACINCGTQRWVGYKNKEPISKRCVPCMVLNKKQNASDTNNIGTIDKPVIGDIRKKGELWPNKIFKHNSAYRALYIYTSCPSCNTVRWVCLKDYKVHNGLCKSCAHDICHNGKPGAMLGHHHSDATKTKIAKSRIAAGYNGEKCYQWNGGRKISRGYVLVLISRDDFFFPMASEHKSSGSYVLEHRLVMAKHLGRLLKNEEVVHHKGTKYPLHSNENKQDNRIENLELFPDDASHHKHHYIIECKSGKF